MQIGGGEDNGEDRDVGHEVDGGKVVSIPGREDGKDAQLPSGV